MSFPIGKLEFSYWETGVLLLGNWSSLIGKLKCHNGDSDSLTSVTCYICHFHPAITSAGFSLKHTFTLWATRAVMMIAISAMMPRAGRMPREICRA